MTKKQLIENKIRRIVKEEIKRLNEKLSISKKYNTLDDYENNAKVGDIIWVGYSEDNFKRASLANTFNVVGKDSKGLILTRNGTSKKLRLGADAYDQLTIVVQ